MIDRWWTHALKQKLPMCLAAMLLVAGCSTSPFGSASGMDVTFMNASQTWDNDKDNTVTCEEWKQYAVSSMRQADANGDGLLDAQEWATMVSNDRLFEVANLSYYDANGDGRVSFDELTGKQNLAFKLLDKNGDCKITADEKVTITSVPKPKEKELDQSIPRR
jgi:hypothetical protein